MFNIGWGELLVLIIAGLFILGPERLPSAAAWLGRTVRQVKEYSTGAREQLRNELGPEFDELRKPLEDLRSIRDLDPRKMVARQLFDDGPSAPVKRNGFFSTPDGPSPAVASPAVAPPPSIVPEHPAVRSFRSLSPGERPPVDPDAT